MRYESPKNQTLLEALKQMAPDSSMNTLRSWLKEGRVIVDGIQEKIGTKQILIKQIVTLEPKKSKKSLTVLYSDQHLVVIDKPKGMLSVDTDYGDRSLHKILKEKHKPQKVYVIHRLDRETSGVILYALSENAFQDLKEKLAKRKIKREYIALVEGNVEQNKGIWKNYLTQDANYVVHASRNPKNGKVAVTHYTVMERGEKTTLLKLTLETGRKNQIRVQANEAGHPIVGDKKYGAQTNPYRRLCLHAYKIGFHHPVTKKKLLFESSPPKELKNAS